ADIRAKGAREDAQKAIQEADRAEAYAWSIRMEGNGGPAQPAPTIAQCLNGGLGRLEVECNRCKTRASTSHSQAAQGLLFPGLPGAAPHGREGAHRRGAGSLCTGRFDPLGRSIC